MVGPEGKTLEVQIRTEEMHQHSEHGVAAHWRYKEGGARDKAFDAKIAWLRQVLAWKNEVLGESAGDASRRALFDDTIYVLTPQGRVIDLPAGSTPLDFAYHVHTDLGHRCRGAKVDGQMVPLNYRLQNAQRVEIMAAKQGGPSRDWIAPQTRVISRARAPGEGAPVVPPRGLREGRGERPRRARQGAAAPGRHGRVPREDRARRGPVPEAGGFLRGARPRRGDQRARSRSRCVAKPAAPPPAPGGAVAPPAPSRTSSGVLVLGVNNIATLVAKCCKPVPPDPIVGFVTRTRGVTVHRQDCPNVIGLAPDQRERLMPADWGKTGDEAPFSADLEVVALDRQGLLRDVSEAISRERINVTAVNTLSRGAHAYMRFTLQVGSADGILRVLRQVSDVPGVDTARRL